MEDTIAPHKPRAPNSRAAQAARCPDRERTATADWGKVCILRVSLFAAYVAPWGVSTLYRTRIAINSQSSSTAERSSGMREVTGSIPAWLNPFRASGLAVQCMFPHEVMGPPSFPLRRCDAGSWLWLCHVDTS